MIAKVLSGELKKEIKGPVKLSTEECRVVAPEKTMGPAAVVVLQVVIHSNEYIRRK